MTTYIPTGNEYISIPTIRQSDGAIDSVNVVLEKLDGLLELSGGDDRPFLRYYQEEEEGSLSWKHCEDWIPMFHRENGDPSSAGYILAPPDQRFFAYSAPKNDPLQKFEIHLEKIFQTINVRHEITSWVCRIQPFNWSWKHGVVIDLYAGDLLLSISFRCWGEAEYICHANGGRHQLDFEGTVIETNAPFTLEIIPKEKAELSVGFGLSRVGARAAELETHRIDRETWLDETRKWLASRAISVAGDPVLSMKVNRNGHFARFYAMAKTLDSSKVVSMTSRSHRYYVSAAYWDRDSLLWLYPFLVRNDRAHALELLDYAFGPQLMYAGIHSRQIGGQILEYGFELDELCAPLLALGTWEMLYPEHSIWGDSKYLKGARELLGRLRSWYHDGMKLYRTELMPTDDALVNNRDVLTYNNALVLHTLRLMLPFAEEFARDSVWWIRESIAMIPSSIEKHLVRDGIYQWSTNCDDSVEFYDEAAGSLMLLPYYGLCDVDSPTFQKTVQTLYSSEYPYRLKGNFSELGNRHTDGKPHPWVLSACNSILSGVRREQGLDFLRRAPMDGGIACESVNTDTGLPESGEHFGTCAGFVAHAIASGTQSQLYGKQNCDTVEQDRQCSESINTGGDL